MEFLCYFIFLEDNIIHMLNRIGNTTVLFFNIPNLNIYFLWEAIPLLTQAK